MARCDVEQVMLPLAVLVAIAVALPAYADEPHSLDRMPPVERVIKQAYRVAGLASDPTRGWIRRARLAGLVPWLSVRTGRDTSWQTTAADRATDIDHGLALELRATWRLDRLVFDGRELGAASHAAARGRERRELASRVIKLYYAARRAPEGAARDEAIAELDALTDGWVGDELRR